MGLTRSGSVKLCPLRIVPRGCWRRCRRRFVSGLRSYTTTWEYVSNRKSKWRDWGGTRGSKNAYHWRRNHEALPERQQLPLLPAVEEERRFCKGQVSVKIRGLNIAKEWRLEFRRCGDRDRSRDGGRGSGGWYRSGRVAQGKGRWYRNRGAVYQ